MRLKLAIPLATVAVAVTIAGCGDPVPNRDAPAGTVVQVGGVAYQVQLSRELNPDMGSDQPFFAGVPDGGRDLPGDQVWLGVFLQATNLSHGLRRPSSDITVADAFDDVHRPVRLPAANQLAFRASVLTPGQQEPSPDGLAGAGPEEGALLLFRMPEDQFAGDRPLELRIAAGGHLASVQLDI